jgi:hypothetical protein
MMTTLFILIILGLAFAILKPLRPTKIFVEG